MSSLQTVAMSPASISVSSPGMMSVGSPLTQLSSLQTSITPPSAGSFPAPPPPNAFAHHHALNPHHHHRGGGAGVTGYPTPYAELPLYPGFTPLSVKKEPSSGASDFEMLLKKEDFDLSHSGGGAGGLIHHPLQHGQPVHPIPMGMHTPTSYDGNNSNNSYPQATAGSGSGSHTPHTTTQQQQQQHQPTPTTTTPVKVEKLLQSPIARLEARKKERRKQRPNSLESSAESEASGMDVDPSNPGQVDAVSSTANFKSPLSALGMGDSNDANASGCDKQVSDRWVGLLKLTGCIGNIDKFISNAILFIKVNPHAYHAG